MKEDINQITHKIIGCAMQVHRMLENGFGQVEVAPQPGALTRIDCSMPHPAGTIVVALRKKADGKSLPGSITLPSCISGRYVWAGKSRVLRPGLNVLE